MTFAFSGITRASQTKEDSSASPLAIRFANLKLYFTSSVYPPCHLSSPSPLTLHFHSFIFIGLMLFSHYRTLLPPLCSSPPFPSPWPLTYINNHLLFPAFYDQFTLSTPILFKECSNFNVQFNICIL